VKGFGLGDDEAGAGVILILGRSVLASDFDAFDDGVDSAVVCACSPLDEAVFGSGDAGAAEAGGPPSLANRLARICGIAELVSYPPERLTC
jgi:hypothetical protein